MGVDKFYGGMGGVNTKDRQLVPLVGSFAVGADGSVTAGTVAINGVSDVEEAADGKYKISLDDVYVGGLKSITAPAAQRDLEVENDSSTDTDDPHVDIIYKAQSLTEVARTLQGGILTDPTTGSTQATGAAGATDWNVDISAAVVSDGTNVYEVAAAADFAIHDTTIVDAAFLDADPDNAIISAVVVDYDSTPAFKAVEGAVAETGSEVAPADSAITTALTHANWVRIGESTLVRTGDTSVTESQDNTVREDTSVTFAAANSSPVSTTIYVCIWLRRSTDD